MFKKLLQRLFGSKDSSEHATPAEAKPPASTQDQPSSATQQPRRSRKEIRAAAADRRRSNREAVRRKHETDIVFLGRSVSRGLADRTADEDRLRELGLPVLATPADLANALGISISKLRWLAFHNDAATRTHYITFEIPRRSGGTRVLSTPHRTLAAVQAWILDEILGLISVHKAAHGFVAGRSVVTNARPHAESDLVLNIDLKDFFPSITFWRVEGLLRSLGYSPAVATILALLCTEAPRTPLEFEGTLYHVTTGLRCLPQGACTSPALSNLIVSRLDRRLQGLADRLGWTYTRYADDITWSTNGAPSPSIGYVLARLRHIIDDEGFSLNDAKTRILRPNQRQAVTGITVNDGLHVPRKTVRRVRAILHNAQFTGLAAQNRDNHPYFESWLLGMIGWISMVQPKTGSDLRSQFDSRPPESGSVEQDGN